MGGRWSSVPVRTADATRRALAAAEVLLDRERCILCQRCTRFSEEIAGDKFIDLMDRSSGEQINVYRDDFFGGAGTGDGGADGPAQPGPEGPVDGGG